MLNTFGSLINNRFVKTVSQTTKRKALLIENRDALVQAGGSLQQVILIVSTQGRDQTQRGEFKLLRDRTGISHHEIFTARFPEHRG